MLFLFSFTLWWKMWRFRSNPESASIPPKGFTTSNRIFSSWKKSFWSFCFHRFLFFDSAEQTACPRVSIFHAIVRCVCRRCCLRCRSESRLGFFWWWWGKENGGGKSEWNRGGLSDTDSPGEGEFGRDRQVGIVTPCTHTYAQIENEWFSFRTYRKYFKAALQVILSRLCCLLACSSLFGFQKLHEDGARTKALLMKVAHLTGCISQLSSTLPRRTHSELPPIMHGREFAPIDASGVRIPVAHSLRRPRPVSRSLSAGPSKANWRAGELALIHCVLRATDSLLRACWDT